MGRNMHSTLRPNQPAYVRLARTEIWLPDDKTRPALAHPSKTTLVVPAGGNREESWCATECVACDPGVTFCKTHDLRSADGIDKSMMERPPMRKRSGMNPRLSGKHYDPKRPSVPSRKVIGKPELIF